MLNKINIIYTSLKIKTKIQLYILPLLCCYLIFFFIKPEKKVKVTKNKISETFNKKFKESYLDLFSKIETNAKNNKVEINILKNKEKIVFIKGNSSLLNLKKFISYIESMNNFTNLISLNISKLNISKYDFELNIALNTYFIKKKISIESKKIEKKKFTLTAIVDKFVFLENKWIKIGESVGKYKLIKIEKDFIILRNKNETLKVELKNDRYTKYIN